MITIKPPSVQDFLQTIAPFSIQEKFYKWQNYLQTLKQSQSPFYQAILEKFLEYYPFNHSFWEEAASLSQKAPKSGKANAIRLYQVALGKNPRSIILWKKYLNWLKKEICKSDPNYLKREHDKAIKIIGNHYKAGFIFENAFNLEESPHAKYTLLKKALVSPIQDIDLLYDIGASWLSDPALLMQSLFQISNQQGILSQGDTDQIIRQKLISQLRKLYQPTKKHVQLRIEWENKLSENDEYSPHSGNIEVWRGYLSWLKTSGNPDLVTSLFQRALITNCDNQALWEEYFLTLENESNFGKALYLLRSHAVFFRSFSREITYYWVQLEQRDNHNRSRQIYLQLERVEPNLQVFLRHIQMQIRYKQFLNARVLYESLFTAFTSNPNILAFLLTQYAQLSLKYFRDVDVRKLLRSYFDAYPFHEGMFFSLLQFYKNHVESKDNSKEGKEANDQFLAIILDGLSRAIKLVPDRYPYISKVARKYLRDFVPSIFLVKVAERKIKQMQLRFKREQNSGESSLKRQASGLNQQD